MNRENTQKSKTYDWLEDALLTVCRNAFPSEASLRVHSLKRRVNRVCAHRDYEFYLQSPDTEIRLALRLHCGLFSIWGTADRIKPAREYSASLHAYQSGVSATFPYGFTTSDQPFGKPYLLHDPGDGLRWWEIEESLRVVQGETIHYMAEELVKLHYAVSAKHPLIPTVDVHSVMKRIWNRVSNFASDELRKCYEQCLKDLKRVETPLEVMLHGQFDLDHLLLQNGRIRTIIDWEHAVFGDPRWDVAHTSLSLQRGKERSFSNQFVSHYSQLAEMRIEDIGLWEGLTALKNWMLSVWLQSLDEKSFQSIAGVQTPWLDRENEMQERALSQFA